MSTFSTTVTKAQRNARDFDSRGREISICSRQHTGRPGYNPSPYEPKVVTKKSPSRILLEAHVGIHQQPVTHLAKPAAVQVRPNTKRGSRSIKQTPHRPIDATLPQFYEAGCEFLHSGKLVTTSAQFLAVKTSAGDVCTTGCAWFKNGACPAYKMLLEREGAK
mgnify:CR=1 FL=1